jgi:CubicO group peptidase (beta-lactamase class C family)
LRDFSHPAGFDEFSGDLKDILQPLVFQPGEGWQYGVNIDYAGLALERLTGLSLNDYCHKNIFGPLELKNISMFPTADMKKKLALMHYRKPDGTIIARDHLLRKPLVVESAGVKDVFNSAGAGAFSKPADYARKCSCRNNVLKSLRMFRNNCDAAEHFTNNGRTDPEKGNG